MVNAPRVAVLIEAHDQGLVAAGNQLAARLGLRVIEPPATSEYDYLLVRTDAMLELREPSSKPGRGLFVDFTSLNPRQAARRGGFSRNQPLARAMGRGARRVLDATAGLGHDAALLACMGFQVVAVERSPIVAALLQDGIERALQDRELRERMGGRLEIVNADARDVLRQPSGDFDVAYIDPMFPPKRKASALAKKSIRMVRALVGDDDDAGDLLATARRFCPRVVVKRPTYAPALHGAPTAVIESKLVRYDIYLTPGFAEKQIPGNHP